MDHQYPNSTNGFLSFPPRPGRVAERGEEESEALTNHRVQCVEIDGSIRVLLLESQSPTKNTYKARAGYRFFSWKKE